MKTLLLSVVCGMTINAYSQTKADIEQFRQEVTQNLTENILPFWMNKTVDPNGGF